jgi:aspartyl-tRNA(Asn)/glutamyl-tRNA(Gln) amidotransferase subunit C
LSVTLDDVKKIALLARLELDDTAAERMTRDMNAILGHVEQLGRVDTENVSPLAWLEGKKTPVEPDEVRRFEHTAEVLDNAPSPEGRFFIVPRVIE